MKLISVLLIMLSTLSFSEKSKIKNVNGVIYIESRIGAGSTKSLIIVPAGDITGTNILLEHKKVMGTNTDVSIAQKKIWIGYSFQGGIQQLEVGKKGKIEFVGKETVLRNGKEEIEHKLTAKLDNSENWVGEEAVYGKDINGKLENKTGRFENKGSKKLLEYTVVSEVFPDNLVGKGSGTYTGVTNIHVTLEVN